MIFLAHGDFEYLEKIECLFFIFHIDLKYGFRRGSAVSFPLKEKFGLVDIFEALWDTGKHDFVIYENVPLLFDFLQGFLAEPSRQKDVLHRHLEMTNITVRHADIVIEFRGGIKLGPVLLFLLNDFCDESLQDSNERICLILAISIKPIIYLPVNRLILHQVHYERVVDEKLDDSQGYFMPEWLLFRIELKLLVGEE